jgi:hypothetical protein
LIIALKTFKEELSSIGVILKEIRSKSISLPFNPMISALLLERAIWLMEFHFNVKKRLANLCGKSKIFYLFEEPFQPLNLAKFIENSS